MRFRRRITIILFSSITIITASKVAAMPIVDQSNTYPVSGGIASFSVYENGLAEYVLAQTFTAGISGKLVGVDLALTDRNATENLAISIVSTFAGLPDLSVAALGMSTLNPGDVDNDIFSLNSVDLTASLIDIIAGQQYAIVLSSATPLLREYEWLHGSFDPYTGLDLSPLDPYAGGAGFSSNDAGMTWSALTTYSQDFAFQTFVVPAQISEPGTLILFIFGIVFLALRGNITLRGQPISSLVNR